MHRAAYAELGLDWRYDAFEVLEDELPAFVASLGEDVRGLSLTMPLKRIALDLVDTVDPVAELIGAANTMLFEPDGSRSAHNTDVPGLVNAFAEQGITAAETAVVVGGGATAASTLAALRGMKVTEVTVVVRDVSKADRLLDLAAELGPKGIRVHAISPGPLSTRAASGIPEFDELLERARTKAPSRTLISIDDVGMATAFLAHDAARLITGATLYVDGGYNIID